MTEKLINIKDRLGSLAHITKALGSLTNGDPQPYADDALYWVSDEIEKVVIELEEEFKNMKV